MLNQKLLDDISARISELIAATPARDIEKNVRALLASAFAHLDLVTREEFDAKALLLVHAQEKLSALEARVAALEKTAGKPG